MSGVRRKAMLYDLAELERDLVFLSHEHAGCASGRLIANNLVLTADHIFRNDTASTPFLTKWKIRIQGERGTVGWRERYGTAVSRRPDLDLALIEIDTLDRERLSPRFSLRVVGFRSSGQVPAEVRGYAKRL